MSAQDHARDAAAYLQVYDVGHAVAEAAAGLAIDPDHPVLNYVAGIGLTVSGQHEAALGAFVRAIVASPAMNQAMLSRGFVLNLLERHEEAIASYQEALALDMPPDVREDGVNNLAVIYSYIGQPQITLDILERTYPHSATVKTVFNKGVMRLGLGDWPAGWLMYRERHRLRLDGKSYTPQISLPRAETLDDVRGRSVLLYHELGFGDTIQFLRYARLLRPLVNELTIGVPENLVRLARHLDTEEPFTVTSNVDLSRCDVAVAMLDQPALFGTTLETIPSGPYFRPLPRLPETKPGIGLCWRGGVRTDDMRAAAIDRRRSIEPDLFGRIVWTFAHEADLVSLQRIGEHRVPKPIRRFVSEPVRDDFDFMDTARVVAQLDLVITVDTAVAHLAAAFGKPTWLLSRYDGCWRWGFHGQTTSPWYGPMTIYRQPAPHAWDEVIDCVIRDLRLRLLDRDWEVSVEEES